MPSGSPEVSSCSPAGSTLGSNDSSQTQQSQGLTTSACLLPAWQPSGAQLLDAAPAVQTMQASNMPRAKFRKHCACQLGSCIALAASSILAMGKRSSQHKTQTVTVWQHLITAHTALFHSNPQVCPRDMTCPANELTVGWMQHQTCSGTTLPFVRKQALSNNPHDVSTRQSSAQPT
jgi:hypothetical protein